MTGSTLEVLEALYHARHSVTDEGEYYTFYSWRSCTVGHLYGGATGAERPQYKDPVNSGDFTNQDVLNSRIDTYRGALLAIVQANNLDCHDEFTENLACAISNAVHARATKLAMVENGAVTDRLFRRASAELIDRAIEQIHERQERDRLDVLAQTRRVVEAAAVEEPVVA